MSNENTQIIYKRFQSPNPLPDGSRPYYIITTLEPERYEEGVNIMADMFVNDEPLCKYSNISSCTDSLATMRIYWNKAVAENTVLVCYEEDETRIKNGEKLKIAGINMTFIQEKGSEGFEGPGPAFAKIVKMMEIIGKELDVYEKFNVDKYLSAIGLYTLPHYRRQGIAKELLLARIPFCKSLGLKVTLTYFTALASQLVAEKCGFTVLLEKTYDDFEKYHNISFPGITTKSCRLMGLEIE